MKRCANLDLGLAVLETIRVPGRRYTLEELAAVCGCSRSYIYLIEKRALAKLKRRVRKLEGMAQS